MLNELEWLEIRVGAQRAGVILVPLNYRLAEAELAAMLEDCEPDLLVVGPEFAELGARMPVPAAAAHRRARLRGPGVLRREHSPRRRRCPYRSGYRARGDLPHQLHERDDRRAPRA